jgi:hypothetical protein
MSSHSESSIANVITALQGTEAFRAQVAAHQHRQLAGNTPPWQGTGLKLEAGQHYSVFASGRIQWSRRHPDLHGGPRFHLWARVAPGGAIVNLRQDTDSFIADHSGELELGIYMGMWQNDRGDLASDLAAYARLEGALEVSLLIWRGTASGGLAALLAAGADHAALSAELKHLEHPQTVQSPVRVPNRIEHFFRAIPGGCIAGLRGDVGSQLALQITHMSRSQQLLT